MSKYIKYISSDHFGAPIMKGDRWGYCVEMLRKTLVEGFNEHTDLTRAEVIDVDKVKYTFTTPHNYVANQTIKISNISFPELNGDVFIISSDANSVTCKPYTNVSGMVGQVIDNITAKAIVAPLGFKEKFKDGNRSVFVTDEDTENAYFYIDDRDPVNNITDWKAANGNTNYTCPLVFMTDKMSDIDTVTGRNIFPYDSNNPNNFKTPNYKFTNTSNQQIPANGILNFVTFGMINTNNYANNAAAQQVPIKYTIIGNGRLFYFIPQVLTGNGTYGNGTRDYIFGFGKAHKITNKKLSPYVLLASAYRTVNGEGCYHITRTYYGGGSLPLSNIQYIQNTYNMDIGQTQFAVLKYKDTPKHIKFYTAVLRDQNTPFVSGGAGSYPDDFTGKFYISPIKMFSDNAYIGNIGGIMWTHNTNLTFQPNRKVIKYNYNNKRKYIYNFSCQMCHSLTGDLTNSGTNFTYAFSFDYEDWDNYE